MGHQIIKQPDGLYAVFSSITSSWVLYDWGREALAGFLAREWGEDVRGKLDLVDEDCRDGITGPRSRAYPVTGLTFEEADRISAEHDGPALSGKLRDAADAAAARGRGPEPGAGRFWLLADRGGAGWEALGPFGSAGEAAAWWRDELGEAGEPLIARSLDEHA
jgi:hypothetical protein